MIRAFMVLLAYVLDTVTQNRDTSSDSRLTSTYSPTLMETETSTTWRLPSDTVRSENGGKRSIRSVGGVAASKTATTTQLNTRGFGETLRSLIYSTKG